MKIELTNEEAECIDTALLNLVHMCERQTVLDENEYQEYKKAYIVFDSAVCKALEERVRKIW
jgi:hypothetical protein